MMLEKNGVRVAAVSYDSQEILAAFAQKHSMRVSTPLATRAATQFANSAFSISTWRLT